MVRIIIRSHSIRLASCDRRSQQRPAEEGIRITLLEVEKASFASTLHTKPLCASHPQLYYRGKLSFSRSSSTVLTICLETFPYHPHCPPRTTHHFHQSQPSNTLRLAITLKHQIYTTIDSQGTSKVHITCISAASSLGLHKLAPPRTEASVRSCELSSRAVTGTTTNRSSAQAFTLPLSPFAIKAIIYLAWSPPNDSLGTAVAMYPV
jgi:hypothetical protein